MRVTYCPFCSGRHDCVAGVGTNGRPSDGDITLCFTCGEWVFFDKHYKGGLRKPTWNEYQHIAFDPLLKQVRGGWLQVMEEKKNERAG
jgi:hypothetical protein